MVGWPCEDLIGSTPERISPPAQFDGANSREVAREKIQKAQSGSPQHFEWIVQRKDQSLIDVELSLSAFELRDQQQLLAIVRDVTERKRNAKRLSSQVIVSVARWPDFAERL